MSDAPRTDALAGDAPWCIRDLCKQLERELNRAKKEIERLKEDRTVFNLVMAEALEAAFVEGWEGCILSGEVSNKYQWKRSDAKKLAERFKESPGENV